jgi:ribosome maturation factor RimP
MSRREQYEARTEELVTPILDENQFELVDVEFVKEGSTWYLRVYIDKEGGITVNDCELVARRMNDILDAEDYISESYVFEVSSPGLGRPLKKEKDYIRNLGKEVEVKTYRAIDGVKEFVGYLKAYTDQEITLADDDDNELTLNKKEIALIREAIDF